MTDDELYNLSDEELEAQFAAAKAEERYEEDEPSTDDDVHDEEYLEEDAGEQDPEDDEIEYETDEDEDEADEDMEQPDEDEDSDDDASEDEDDEEETDEDSEDEEADAADEDEEQTEEVEDKSKEPEQRVQNYSFKANGREYEFTEEEIKAQFPKVFGQAMDYTKKMQAMKPWRKTIDAIESAKLGHDEVSLMIDVLKGDKDAINEVLKRTGVDTIDLDTEGSNYTPKDYGRDDATLALKDVIDEISSDEEYATTYRVLSKEWDDSSWNELSSKPEMIKALHVDVKSGMYDRLMPMVEKLKVYDNGRRSDLEYYGEAAGVYARNIREEQMASRVAQDAQADREAQEAREREIAATKEKQRKAASTKESAKKRKAAVPAKKTAGRKKAIDYLDDSDEAFEEWYNSVQDM